ncbi:MAG: TlpA family protein disulfide reductase, partial [Bacteroidetes bacterium]|nr:TlpA family protein disulfide reductase [Bacteroidota bacterium]
MKKIIAGLLLCSPLLTCAQNGDVALRNRLMAASTDSLALYVKQHPDAGEALEALKSRFGAYNHTLDVQTVAQVQKIYDGFSPRVRGGKTGKEYGELLKKLSGLLPGAVLPDFSAPDTDGKTVRLSSLRGKYVLVDFWASWCIPCRKEFPHLKKAYAKYKDKNFEIVGYSIDNDKSLWVSAVENDDTPWIQLSLLKGVDDPIARQYEVHGVPENWLLDPTGKIIAVNLRGEQV